jgi:hypothetical protein
MSKFRSLSSKTTSQNELKAKSMLSFAPDDFDQVTFVFKFRKTVVNEHLVILKTSAICAAFKFLDAKRQKVKAHHFVKKSAPAQKNRNIKLILAILLRVLHNKPRFPANNVMEHLSLVSVTAQVVQPICQNSAHPVFIITRDQCKAKKLYKLLQTTDVSHPRQNLISLARN